MRGSQRVGGHGSGKRRQRWLAAFAAAALAGCAGTPAPQPLDPARTLSDFSARRLESVAQLPPAAAGWDRSQWFLAALALNPELAQQRAEVAAVAAAERTAAEIPNPNMELFAEYLKTAAESPAWLYGVSLRLLLRRPRACPPAPAGASAQTALAQSELSDSIWQARADLRQALLEVVAAQDEAALLAHS